MKPISVSKFSKPTIQRHLVYFDGPFISEVIINKKKYICWWCDVVEEKGVERNRWLLVEMPSNITSKYVNKKVNSLEFLASGKEFFFVDMNHRGSWHQVLQISFEEIPEDYLPEPCFYEGQEEEVTI